MQRGKLKVRRKGERTQILALIRHPMETGFRKDKRTGKTVPAHYIKELVIKHNGQVVANGHLGSAVSTDPLFIVTLKSSALGDEIEVHWSDNKGESDTLKTKIE